MGTGAELSPSVPAGVVVSMLVCAMAEAASGCHDLSLTN